MASKPFEQELAYADRAGTMASELRGTATAELEPGSKDHAYLHEEAALLDALADSVRRLVTALTHTP